MKWLKRLLLLIIFLAVFAGVLGTGAWWMSRRPPTWYVHHKTTAQQAADAAQRAERQVQRTLSWAADQQAYADSSRVGPPSTQPARTFQITFSEDELNGFFQKWNATFGWSQRYDAYLADPAIVIDHHHLILAATVKDMNTVISVEFAPRLVDGKLEMPVEKVLAGRLPLPATFWDNYRQMLETSVRRAMPQWQAGAKIRPNGTANMPAVAAAMGQLLLNILNDRPARAVFFLPYDVSNSQRSLPVKLTSVQIKGQSLVMTVTPLSPDDRQALLESIRSKDDSSDVALTESN